MNHSHRNDGNFRQKIHGIGFQAFILNSTLVGLVRVMAWPLNFQLFFIEKEFF